MKQAIKIFPPDVFNYGENWTDYYLEIKQLRKGDIFYECESRTGENYELRAIEDARKTRNGWICKVETSDKKVVEFYVSANTTYNGPNLFRSPQNLSFIDGKGYVYIVH